jgi:DNA-binding CsgD family transcriptional regulator
VKHCFQRGFRRRVDYCGIGVSVEVATMSKADDQFLDLVATVYDAALATELWPQVAADAGRALNSSQVMLGVTDRSGREVTRASSDEWGERLDLSSYTTPESNPGVAFAALTPPMTVGLTERMVSDRDLERSEFYQTLMRPLGLWRAAIVNVHRDESVLAPMGFLRTRKERPFGEPELLDLRRLAPHLNRALRVSLRLRELETRAESCAQMADRALVALVLTDATGRIAETNGLARAILAERDGLVIRDGVLRVARNEEGAELARLIREAAGSRVMPMSGVMRVSRPSLRRPLPLVVAPTRNAASPFGRSHAVCVSFADPERAPEADAALLARLYGLTPREARVAVSLLQGRSPAEAAAELAMTENTVRTHIRHAFEKTGVERLSDFVRLLMQGPGVRAR